MKSIQFWGLFGHFDYNITFCNEGLTILTGPNGFGKTTILRVIEALSKGQEGISYFENLDFRSIKLNMLNGSSFLIQKNDNQLMINRKPFFKSDFLDLYLKDVDQSFAKYLFRYERLLPAKALRPYKSVEEELRYLDLYKRKFNVIQDVIKDKENYLKHFVSDASAKKEFALLEGFKEKVYFIHEQRLLKSIDEFRLLEEENEDGEINQETIADLPENFKCQIRKVIRMYTNLSTKLDESYPRRLLNDDSIFSKEDFIKRFDTIQEYNNRLSEYGLSVKFVSLVPEFNEKYARALKVYCDDIDQKYAVYKGLIKKLDLYTEIVNSRFRFKKCFINPDKGLVIKEGDNEIDLKQLSSGEKQTLVLFYELIFNIKKGMLILIDEPEISLHIVWQERFIDDLKRIININDCTALVATHSPQVINNNWDLQVDLGGLYSAQLNHG